MGESGEGLRERVGGRDWACNEPIVTLAGCGDDSYTMARLVSADRSVSE